MYKMDKTLEIMAKETGIDLDSAYCPFRDSSRCMVKTGLCDDRSYQVCAFYGARIIEIWREKLNKEKRQEYKDELVRV
jgi:hypothetical protein